MDVRVWQRLAASSPSRGSSLVLDHKQRVSDLSYTRPVAYLVGDERLGLESPAAVRRLCRRQAVRTCARRCHRAAL